MPRKLLLRVCLLGCGSCFFKDLIVAYPNLKLIREIDKFVCKYCNIKRLYVADPLALCVSFHRSLTQQNVFNEIDLRHTLVKACL